MQKICHGISYQSQDVFVTQTVFTKVFHVSQLCLPLLTTILTREPVALPYGKVEYKFCLFSHICKL